MKPPIYWQKLQCPIILAGGGVITSGASDEIVQMSDLLMAPVATTFMGKGAFPENHPLSLGSIGMHGNPAANRLMGEADVLLGSRNKILLTAQPPTSTLLLQTPKKSK